jgi:hypothetical protein
MLMDWTDQDSPRRPGTFRAPASRHPTCMLPECTLGTRTRGHEPARYGASPARCPRRPCRCPPAALRARTGFSVTSPLRRRCISVHSALLYPLYKEKAIEAQLAATVCDGLAFGPRKMRSWRAASFPASEFRSYVVPCAELVDFTPWSCAS